MSRFTAIATVLLAAAVAASGSTAQEAAPTPGHSRALALVLDRMFGEDGGVVAEAERKTRPAAGSARVWRVRSVGQSRDRFDVIFYVGDRPACVWRVDLNSRQVTPDGCSLELWDDPRA